MVSINNSEEQAQQEGKQAPKAEQLPSRSGAEGAAAFDLLAGASTNPLNNGAIVQKLPAINLSQLVNWNRPIDAHEFEEKAREAATYRRTHLGVQKKNRFLRSRNSEQMPFEEVAASLKQSELRSNWPRSYDKPQ